MKSWLRYLPIIVLCTALFTGYADKAQASKGGAAKAGTEEDIPAKIRGDWALPDCKSYDEAIIITRHFYLRSDKDGSQFWPLESVQKQKDYWVMPIEGEKHPVRVEADGVLKIGLLTGKPPEKWPKSWDALQMDGRREYTGCAEVPAILPDPLVRVMKHIDEIEEACNADLSPTCTKLLFDIADENKNGKISVREMKTAAAMLVSIAALVENNTVSRSTLDKAVYQSMRETDRIAARVTPKGKELSYKDFTGFLKKSDSILLRDTLMGIGTLIPGFKE